MNRLCALAAVLAVIAQERVTVLPGWSVPLPAVILAAVLGALAVPVAVLAAVAVSRARPRAVPCCGCCMAARRPVPVLSWHPQDGTDSPEGDA